MRTPTTERYPMSPFPSGWYRVAGADELERGEVKALHYFGRDLALFRTRSGEMKLLDALCPHLGAHLGAGGKVVGDTLRCPFHGWGFDGTSGRCRHIPKVDKPLDVGVKAWPLTVVAGQLLTWWHPEDIAPTWTPDDLPEVADPEWEPFKHAHSWQMRTHVQQLAENAMDTAHFPVMHAQQTKSIDSTGVTIDGPSLVHSTYQEFAVFGLLKHLSGDAVVGPLDAQLLGLGMVINRATVEAQMDMSYVVPFFVTPIDGERIQVESFLAVKRLPVPGLTKAIALKAKAEVKGTIDQDIPVWETQRFLVRPRLSRADGPIMAFRKWSRQFYPDGGAAVYGHALAPEDTAGAAA